MKKFIIKMAPYISPAAQLILSIAALCITLTFSREQNKIAKFEYSPVFILSIDQLFRKDYTPTQSEKFDIFNEGYPINNYNYNFTSIMSIAYTVNYKSYEKKLIVDYFSVQSKKSGGKDRMSGGIGEDNVMMLRELKQKITKNLNEKGINIIRIELHHYAKISYSDMELNQGDVYFADAERVEKDEYEKGLAGIDTFYTISLYTPNIDEIVSMTLKK
jgi:hypothetical protein